MSGSDRTLVEDTKLEENFYLWYFDRCSPYVLLLVRVLRSVGVYVYVYAYVYVRVF